MAPSTPEQKITHAKVASTSRRRLQASGRKYRSDRWAGEPVLGARAGVASGLIKISPRPDDGERRGPSRRESSGSDVMSRKAGGTTDGPVRRSTRRCWWNSPMESPDRRSDFRRRRLGTSTAAQTMPRIRRTTIVKNPSIYLPMSFDPTKTCTTMGGWSGTVRVFGAALSRCRPGAAMPAPSTAPPHAPHARARRNRPKPLPTSTPPRLVPPS